MCIRDRLHVATDGGGVKLQVTGSSSSVTPSNDADEIFIDNVGNSGMTIGSGTSNKGSIHFGDSGDNNIGIIEYNHSDNSLSFYTNATKQLEIDSSGTLEATVGNTVKGQPTLGNDMMSLGFGAPNGEIKAKNSSASPASNVDIHTTNSSGTTARVFRATHDGNIQLMSGDTVIGKFSNSSSDFVIESDVQDKDIIFKGDDNGSSITALTLDMSDAGTATFNHDIKIADDGKIGSATTPGAITIEADGQFTLSGNAQIPNTLYRGTDGNITMFGANNDIRLTHVHDTGLLLTNTVGSAAVLQFADANESVSSDGTNLILTSGGTAFKMPTSDGSAGQQLTTDGAGNLSWSDVDGSSDISITGNEIKTTTSNSDLE